MISQIPKRERNRAEQRRRILDAARLLFAQNGVEGVTVAEVASEAGVARATVFNYFASKHALVEAITQEVFAYYCGMLERALALEDVPVPTLIRAAADHMGMGIEAVQTFYRGVFREIMKMQVGLEEGGAAHGERAAALARLRELMARGQERGELASEHGPEDLAWAFESLTNGTIVHWLYDDASDSLRERMRRAGEIFLGSVAVGHAAADAPLPDLTGDSFPAPPLHPDSRAPLRAGGTP